MIEVKAEIIKLSESGELTTQINKGYHRLIKPIKAKYYKKVIRLKILEWNEVREEAASRLFHRLRDLLAKHECVDKELLKTQLKIAYGVSQEVYDRFNKKTVNVLKSTGKYTWDEMLYLIRMTEVECLDRGIDISSPVTELEELLSKERETT